MAQARLAVIEAAKLHASHWGDEGLDELPWVSNSKARAPASAATPGAVSQLWQGFKQRYGPRLEPHWVDAGEKLTARFAEIARQHDGPRCLTHNDFRPDNMMFGGPGGGYPLTVLDWQSFAYGAGPTDLAYFLAGAIPPELRREHEPYFLALYLHTLTAHGVTGYGLDDLERHYAQGGYLLFLTAFFAAMIVTQTERGDAMFLQMIRGSVDHMLDHGALG